MIEDFFSDGFLMWREKKKKKAFLSKNDFFF